MAIRKLDMQDRFATLYDDGSISVHPEGYTAERAHKETWDKNERDPVRQPKIAVIAYYVKEVIIDPAALAQAKDQKCPVCGREPRDEQA